jgi:polar amino acid transport system substrate-binding protein
MLKTVRNVVHVRRMSTAVATSGLALALAVGASACSSSSSSSSTTAPASSPAASSTGSSSASSSTPSPTSSTAALAAISSENAASMAAAASVKLNPTLAAELPSSISSTKQLVIAAQLTQPPDDLYAADGTTPIGFEVAMATALANEMGLTVKYIPGAFDSLITTLQAGRVDMTMSAMNDTIPREQAVNFVDYLTDGIGLLVNAGNPDNIQTPTDLCGKSVTAVSGSTQQTYAGQLSATCKAAGKAPVTLILSSTTAQETISLETKRVAAVLNDNITDAYDVATSPSLFSAVQYAPIEPGPYGIGVNKDDPKLLTAIQTGLQDLMNDGTYDKILSDWQLSSVALKTATVNHGIPG